MSDSKDSTVTYTVVSSPFGGLSDIRSPRDDGLPMMPKDPYAYVVAAFQAPPSPDYVSGPEHPPLPEFVPEPVYPEFMPSKDEVFPAEEKPLSSAVSPTAESPGYIADFDPEEDPADYHVDEGDDDNDDDGSFDDDDNVEEDEDEDEDEEEEEEEHPAPVDSLPPPPVHCVRDMRSMRVLLLQLLDPLKVLEWIMVLLLLWMMRSDVTPERDVGYGITNTWDEMLMGMPWEPATDDTELGQHMTDFTTTVRQDTDEIYGRLDDAQDDRALICGRVNMLYKDRCDHARTARLMKTKTRLSRQAWVQSMDVNDLARSEVMELHTQMVAQHSEIVKLRAADRRRQAQFIEALKLLKTSQNSEDNHDSGISVRRQAPPGRECTYQDFMKCKPLYFKGTEGVVKLTQWLQSTFSRTGIVVCSNVPEESDKVERHVSGLLDVIHGSVVVSRPKTMQEVIEMANELMDKKNNNFAERQAENKQKFDDTSKNNQNQQQQQQQHNKRQNIGMTYTAGSNDKKPYGGSKPLCPKCNYHHDGQCAPKCYKCNRVGRLARDCRSAASTNTANNQMGTGIVQKPTCFECGA
uniref:CCHC-type domain-containing protein n=1 Tax=Tanacetum cinerariifolium TaxID=118510 RepID=A0A6L2J056_TANCI|nr:hypothetical protein [Tanacetum cinerariifolium]